MPVALDEWLATLPVGVIERSEGRTIDDGQFALLTNLTWTTGLLHSDGHYMKSHPFGRLILGGPVVAAIISGLWRSSCWDRFSEQHGLRAIGALGAESRFRAPVFAGDTLWSETALTAARTSKSKDGAFVLTFHDDGVNQRGEKVIEMNRSLLCVRNDMPLQDAMGSQAGKVD
jgi:itaconyl-CoA hydratase